MTSLTTAIEACREIRANLAILRENLAEISSKVDSLQETSDRFCGSLIGAGRNADNRNESSEHDLLQG